jgi:hypothetical protein
MGKLAFEVDRAEGTVVARAPGTGEEVRIPEETWNLLDPRDALRPPPPARERGDA